MIKVNAFEKICHLVFRTDPSINTRRVYHL